MPQPTPSTSAPDPLSPVATAAEVGAAAWALVDDPAEWPTFSAVTPQPDCWDSHVVLRGMHCAACALTIEDALRRVPGVLDVDVSAAAQRARVRWSAQQVQPSAWMRAVRDAGYEAVPANDAGRRQVRVGEGRKALWRLGVAGLCMMQVMMYAYPAYTATPGEMAPDLLQLLRWASWLLSLPVLLFSCGPFFRNAWRDVVRGRVSMDLPVALGMLITFGVSSLGTFEPNGPFGREVYFDSLTMFVFFLLGGRWLELRLRDRTAGALEAVLNRMPESVLRLSADESEPQRISVRRLRSGDAIRVLPGEAFAADGVVLRGHTRVDEALLSGESHPRRRGPGDAVVAGSYNREAVVDVRVQRVGDATRFAQIVTLMESAAASKPQLARLADRLAKPFLVGVLLAAAGAGAWWWSQGAAQALMVAVSVLVVTCPCALSLATPSAMLAAAGALARRGVLVRDLNALEALASVDTVVFDKTGTLTRDALTLQQVWTAKGVTRAQALAWAAALAQGSMHPVARAVAGAASPLSGVQATGVREFAGAGIEGHLADAISGAAEAAAELPTWRLGSVSFCGLDSQKLWQDATVHLCREGVWIASFDLQEEVREDATATIARVRALGLGVALWSGDRVQAVHAVAQAVGIADSQTIGACTPEDKLRNLRRLQDRGRRVLVVGDGLNDGPLLAGAQVSLAFGAAVPLTQAGADLVVPGERLLPVVRTLEMAGLTMRVVRQNLLWAALYNVACIPLALLGWLPAWAAGLGMAASSLLVIANAWRLSRAAPMSGNPKVCG